MFEVPFITSNREILTLLCADWFLIFYGSLCIALKAGHTSVSNFARLASSILISLIDKTSSIAFMFMVYWLIIAIIDVHNDLTRRAKRILSQVVY